ncbi:MAG TPA: hypothetical protein VI895_06010 [Bdellovibrionota bacterium]|nr:hypothetical protein [Bdellovibrionota bacterium]
MRVNAVYQILERPKVYLSIGAVQWSKINQGSRGRIYLLAHPIWAFGGRSIYLYFKHKFSLARRNVKLILLNNSASEDRMTKCLGFESYLINHNIHVSESDFRVEPRPKKYDAVYMAQAKPFKRIHLARQVRSLYVITYFWPDVRDKNGLWDLHAFEPSVSHAEFNRDRISASEINRILNESYCGLALSRKEGAMFSSMEYLFAGLPIVSTKSIGGRDFFFDDRFVRIVKSDAEQVSEGVAEFKRLKLDPHIIRKVTLEKVMKSRKDFFDVVCDIAKREGAPLDESFEAFHNRIWGVDALEKLSVIIS